MKTRKRTQFAAAVWYLLTGLHKEKLTGSKDDRAERKKVLALAQARIDIIL